MTNEISVREAVELLKEKRMEINYKVNGTTQFSEALDMGIKALESQSCEDCVSREAAKAFLYERLDRLNDDELYDIFSKIIDDFYNELPSVTPQRKRGEWIEENEALTHCNKCGMQIFTVQNWFKYCPECGSYNGGNLNGNE